MFILLDDLVKALQSRISLQPYNINPEQTISDINLLPPDFDSRPMLADDTVYICEYRQLLRLETMPELPPIICVIERNHSADSWLLHGKNVIAVYGTTVMDVLVLLTDAVYEIASRTSRITEVTRQLAQCSSLEELLETGFALLQNPLVLTDASQKIIRATRPELVANPRYRYIVNSEYLPTGHPNLQRQHAEPSDARNQMSDVYDRSGAGSELPDVICNSLSVGDQTLGYLHALAFNREFSQEDRQVIQLLTDLLAFKLYRRPELSSQSPSERISGFFRDVLDENAGDAAQILERQQDLKIPLKRTLYAMLVFPKTETFTAHYSFADLIRAFPYLLPGSYCFLYKDGVFAVLSSDTEIADMQAYLAPLQPTLEQYQMMVGISHPFTAVYQLPFHGYQARKAIYYGAVMDKDRYVYNFSDYVLTYIADVYLKHGDLETVCPPGLVRLVRQSEKAGSELWDTLKVYLKYGRNKTQTAKALYIHINTVKYRISQIQEITGLDLEDDSVAQQLMLVCKMFEFKEHFNDTDVEPPPRLPS